MNRIKHIAIFMIAAMLTLACERPQRTIVTRALQQVEVSMPEYLQMYGEVCNGLRFENIEPIYQNDTICLLQFTIRYRDAEGNKKVRDYRYTYLFDRMLSGLNGKPVFCEAFENILCLPPELIEECKKEVESSGQSVYNTSMGKTYPVRTPFDSENNK